MAILRVILSSWSDKRLKSIHRESVCSRKCSASSAWLMTPRVKALAGPLGPAGRSWRRHPCLTPQRGLSGTCASPPRFRPAAFCLSRSQQLAAPAGPRRPLRGSWESGSPAGWRSAFPELPASGSSCSLPKNSPCSQASCLARPHSRSWKACHGLLSHFASVLIPRRPPSSAKEPLLNTDIIQNKNFIFFV